MEIKVKNQIRRRPEIIGLALKSFFLLLLSFVSLSLWMIGSFSIPGMCATVGITAVEYGVLYWLDHGRDTGRGDLPDSIVNG